MTASFDSRIVYFYNVSLDHTNGRMLKQFVMFIKYVSAELVCLHLLTELFHKDFSVLMTAPFYSDRVYFYNVSVDHTNGRMLKQFGMVIKYVSAELVNLHLFTELFHKDCSVLMTAPFYSSIIYFYDVSLDHTNVRMLKQFGRFIKQVSAELVYLHLFT